MGNQTFGSKNSQGCLQWHKGVSCKYDQIRPCRDRQARRLVPPPTAQESLQPAAVVESSAFMPSGTCVAAALNMVTAGPTHQVLRGRHMLLVSACASRAIRPVPLFKRGSEKKDVTNVRLGVGLGPEASARLPSALIFRYICMSLLGTTPIGAIDRAKRAGPAHPDRLCCAPVCPPLSRDNLGARRSLSVECC
jgi:hypothetical protein